MCHVFTLVLIQSKTCCQCFYYSDSSHIFLSVWIIHNFSENPLKCSGCHDVTMKLLSRYNLSLNIFPLRPGQWPVCEIPPWFKSFHKSFKRNWIYLLCRLSRCRWLLRYQKLTQSKHSNSNFGFVILWYLIYNLDVYFRG